VATILTSIVLLYFISYYENAAIFFAGSLLSSARSRKHGWLRDTRGRHVCGLRGFQNGMTS
jgi:hypothetical protein